MHVARGFLQNEGNSIYFHKPSLFSNGLSLVRTLAAVNLVAACITNISSSNLKLSASYSNDRELFYTRTLFSITRLFRTSTRRCCGRSKINSVIFLSFQSQLLSESVCLGKALRISQSVVLVNHLMGIKRIASFIHISPKLLNSTV